MVWRQTWIWSTTQRCTKIYKILTTYNWAGKESHNANEQQIMEIRYNINR